MPVRPLSMLQYARPGDHVRWALLAVLVLGLWLVCEQLSAQLWFLPAGLRLGLLWLVPTRRWGWLALAEVGAQAAKSLSLGYPFLTSTFIAVCIAPWVIYAVVVLLLRGPDPGQPFDGPGRMLRFLMAGLVSAAIVSPLLWAFLVTVPMSTAETLTSLFRFLYGDLIGQIVIGPLLLVLAWGLPRRGTFWRDLGVVSLAALATLLLVLLYGPLADYVILLAFAPLFFLGFRQGWEGAALGIALLGVIVQGMAQAELLGVGVTVLQLQLAVTGGGALVLGAASTALRLSHDALASRHRELAAKNEELGTLADEIRLVTQRLVRMEEQGQRELASELDYELGHAIHALDHGPLRDMLDDAGIEFATAFEGPIDVLDDDARTSVYRICQAAVREAVRLETVRRLALRLTLLSPAGAPVEVGLEIDIAFSPYAEPLPAAAPLPAIRDRVLAEHGQYVVEPLADGQRHRVAFRPADT